MKYNKDYSDIEKKKNSTGGLAETAVCPIRVLDNIDNWLKKSTDEYYSSVLEGLTLTAVGDSYFEGDKLGREYVWLSLLSKKYGIVLNNYGINGSTVSDYVTEYNPMCCRVSSITASGADIVLIEGGRNDFNNNVPIGTEDSRDTKTYSGALNVIIDAMKQKNPKAMFVCISPWNFTDSAEKPLTYLDYANAMERIAYLRGLYFIRACDPTVSGIDMRNAEFRAENCLKPTSVSHLNLEGMKKAMTHFEKILAAYYSDFINKKTQA